jgi:hypothetical protein
MSAGRIVTPANYYFSRYCWHAVNVAQMDWRELSNLGASFLVD